MMSRIGNILEKLRSLYWGLVPHHRRPFYLWYRIKCFFYHRYTTVKPRTLDFHTWCDRSVLLPHMMFEILVQFVEKELNNADGSRKSEHTFLNGDKEINVRDEIYDLYDWWTKDWLINYERIFDEWHNLCNEHRTDYSLPVDVNGNSVPEEEAELFEWKTEWSSIEMKDRADRLLKEAVDKECAYDQELIERMSRLSRVHGYLWT